MAVQSKLTFPLLKLPYLAVIEVLKGIELTELVLLSLISRKMKSLVKSVGISDVRPIISVSSANDRIEIGFHKLWMCIFTVRLPEDHTLESCVSLSHDFGFSRRKEKDVSKRNFTFRDYILHFLEVTNSSGVILDMSEVFDPRPVEYYRNLLKGIKVDGFSVFLHMHRTQAFLPFFEEYFNVNEFELYGQPTDENLIKRIFEREFVSLVLDEKIHVNLKKLLEIKSQNIKIALTFIYAADLNRFLKAWLNHGTNPNLRSLYLILVDESKDTSDPNIVFDGIDYEGIKLKRGVASMKFYAMGWDMRVNITDAFIIKREDGKKAVMSLEPRVFQFIVLEN